MGTLQSLAIGQRHSVCSKRGKISKTHFFACLSLGTPGSTLCLQPSERTQFFVDNRFTVSSFLCGVGVSITRDRIYKSYSLLIQFYP